MSQERAAVLVVACDGATAEAVVSRGPVAWAAARRLRGRCKAPRGRVHRAVPTRRTTVLVATRG